MYAIIKVLYKNGGNVLKEWIIEIMNNYGYVGIALLIAIENVFPPIPSEVILTFGGFMTTYGELNFWGVLIASTIGAVIGALILYMVGRILDAERIERLAAGKIGKILHFEPEDIHKANVWFKEKGSSSVFFCRFIPIVRSLISIPAGMTKMNMGKFLIMTFSGTLIWNFVLIFLGSIAGNAWEKIEEAIGLYSSVVLVILIIICAFLFFIFIKRFLKSKNKD